MRQHVGSVAEIVKVVPLSAPAGPSAPTGLVFALLLVTTATDIEVAAAAGVDAGAVKTLGERAPVETAEEDVGPLADRRRRRRRREARSASRRRRAGRRRARDALGVARHAVAARARPRRAARVRCGDARARGDRARQCPAAPRSARRDPAAANGAFRRGARAVAARDAGTATVDAERRAPRRHRRARRRARQGRGRTRLPGLGASAAQCRRPRNRAQAGATPKRKASPRDDPGRVRHAHQPAARDHRLRRRRWDRSRGRRAGVGPGCQRRPLPARCHLSAGPLDPRASYLHQRARHGYGHRPEDRRPTAGRRTRADDERRGGHDVLAADSAHGGHRGRVHGPVRGRPLHRSGLDRRRDRRDRPNAHRAGSAERRKAARHDRTPR